MKDFATGLTYLRSTALSAGLIGDADTDDTLIERLATLLSAAPKEVIEGVAVHGAEAQAEASEVQSAQEIAAQNARETSGGKKSDGGSKEIESTSVQEQIESANEPPVAEGANVVPTPDQKPE